MENQKYCYILDLERTIGSGQATYWKPSRHGYTRNLSEAGQYPDDVARSIAANDMDEKTVVVPDSVIRKIFGL